MAMWQSPLSGSRGAAASRLLSFFILGLVLFCAGGFAKPAVPASQQALLHDNGQAPVLSQAGLHPLQAEELSTLRSSPVRVDEALEAMLGALEVMQEEYFVLWQGTWPTGIDWTKAVMATHISATLSTLSLRADEIVTYLRRTQGGGGGGGGGGPFDPDSFDAMAYENLIGHYFQHTSAFWFGEDAFSLRMQAYDDMLWVVLEWLENIKFQELHSELHYSSFSNETSRSGWYGKQYKAAAAHRARIFYDLASRGWDTALCDGGMIWSPYLTPYKNAITNELFISASIGMYLYFPGDSIDFPIPSDDPIHKPRNPTHLNNAIAAYDWLQSSKMLGVNNLYADGFHISGWNWTSPGTRKCDVLNTMVYTYNQGVILSGLRGLWLVTGLEGYLNDGHELVRNVIKSTGWPDRSSQEWKGLGRAGVMEDACDSSGNCSQDGHTFKSIFFHHFAEFCRPLSPAEERIQLTSPGPQDVRRQTFQRHQKQCASYLPWLSHNAQAAFVTKNEKGLYGMWWGREYPDRSASCRDGNATIPHGAIDYRNQDFPQDNGPSLAQNSYLPREADRTARPFKNDGTENPGSGDKPGQIPGQGDKITVGPMDNDNRDVNDRGRGRTLETQAGAVAVFRALFQWLTAPSLAS